MIKLHSGSTRERLASFRETTEFEYGANDAFILAPHDGEGASSSRVILKHLKSRHGEARDIALSFDRQHERFTPSEPSEKSKRADDGKLQAALRALWNGARPTQEAGDDEP
jgi:replicative DNA helicase